MKIAIGIALILGGAGYILLLVWWANTMSDAPSVRISMIPAACITLAGIALLICSLRTQSG